MVLAEIETARLDLALARDPGKRVAWMERWAETLLRDAEALETGAQQFSENEIDAIEQNAYDQVAGDAVDVADRLDKLLADLVAAHPAAAKAVETISESVSELREL